MKKGFVDWLSDEYPDIICIQETKANKDQVEYELIENLGYNTYWFDEVLFNEKLGNCRGTGVVTMVNGKWKIAHYALTMLVPNAIAAEVGSQTQEADKL